MKLTSFALAAMVATSPLVSVAPAHAATTATPATTVVMTPGAKAASVPSLGTNLDFLADWTTAYPFVDTFRTSRNWISQKVNGSWGSGPAVATDAKGWVTSLQPGQYVDTAMFSDQNGHAPRGRYVVTWEGDGDVTMWGEDLGKDQILNRTANRFEFDMGVKSMFLKITRTNPQNYVRNIHVWMPGQELSGPTQIFNPVFLDRLKGVSTIRFMDWMSTNIQKSDVGSFAKWPTVDAATQTNGVAPQLITALSNRVGADPWVNMPYAASDDFVRGFATAIRDNLGADRKVYLEYSNENWNGIFAASKYVQDQGVKLGLSTDRYQAGIRYQAQRSVEIFKIWQEVFGAQAGSRLVRVLGAQFAGTYWAEQLLTWKDAYRQADAVAVAPYFGCPGAYKPGDSRLYFPGDGSVAEYVKAAGASKILDNCQREFDTEIRNGVTSFRLLAERLGLALVAYEGGQGLVGVNGGENDAALNTVLQAANRDPRMKDLYIKYFGAWQRNGGGLFVAYTHTSQWSKWSTFGMLEYADQPLTQAPKFVGFQTVLQSWKSNPPTDVVPIVTGLSARSGPSAGGNTVTVEGSRIDAATAVRVGGVNAAFRKVDATHLDVVMPARAASTVDVTVVNGAGESGATAQTSYTYVPPVPSITKFSTPTVPVGGGAVVTLTGTSLTGATSVVIAGATWANNVKVLSDTSVQFTTPAWREGTYDVVVKTPSGPSAPAKLTFAYPPSITKLSMTTVPIGGGTVMTATGTSLGGTTAVIIAGATWASNVTVLSDTQVQFTTPAWREGTYDLVVRNAVGTSAPARLTFANTPAKK